ncbi:murein L,D-transpeptidase [soil metagenome]
MAQFTFPRLILGSALVLASGAAAFAQSPGPSRPVVRTVAPAQTASSAYPQAPAQPAPMVQPLVEVNLRADQIGLIRRALDEAGAHGLDPAAYVRPGLDNDLNGRDPARRRQAMMQLSEGLMAYAQAVHAGRLLPNQFVADWGLRPAPFDPRPGFIAAVQQDRLQDWLASLPPPYAGYDSLRQGLLTYRGVVAAGGWRAVPEGPALKLGDSDPRVALLKARLAVEDSAVQADGATTFDETVEQALARSQKRYGLKPDGVVAGSTLAALNVPAQRRLDQITANLERWRWLPATLPADRIQVNIAAAVLTVFHEDTPTLSMRAVTGRPGDETPMLQSQVQSIVFNPPWNVPSSIATKELWPKERANPGYLAKRSITIINLPGGGTRLQQKAGDASALGRIKFDFPNTYGVYLHDTPSHGTFGTYSRMVSHGCVRLEKPMDLAKSVLAADPRWADDAVEQTIAAGDTIRAPLPQPIAVFLLYWTAYLAPDGSVNFRDDPYSWDKELARRLALAPMAPSSAPVSAVAAL